jgi:excisionase family DNA binding protein
MDLLDVLGAEEAARALGIGADRMRVLLRTGRLPARKVGGRWVVRRCDLPLVVHRAADRPRRAGAAAAGGSR